MEREEEYRKAMLRLTDALNRIDGAYYFCARRLGMQENTLAVLYALDDGQSHTQAQICREWFIPKTTVNTVVRDLVEKGYAVLESGAHSREKGLTLTDRGRAYVRQMLEGLRRAERQALEETLRDGSPRFVEEVEQFAGRLCAAFARQGLL